MPNIWINQNNWSTNICSRIFKFKIPECGISPCILHSFLFLFGSYFITKNEGQLKQLYVLPFLKNLVFIISIWSVYLWPRQVNILPNPHKEILTFRTGFSVTKQDSRCASEVYICYYLSKHGKCYIPSLLKYICFYKQINPLHFIFPM